MNSKISELWESWKSILEGYREKRYWKWGEKANSRLQRDLCRIIKYGRRSQFSFPTIRDKLAKDLAYQVDLTIEEIKKEEKNE
jgi:hypothetical protein